MFGGLFTYSIESVRTAVKELNLPPEKEHVILEHVVPVAHATSFAGYLLTSLFVFYFALFKAATVKGNYACLVARILLILVYCPFIAYCGAYLDSCIIFVALLARFCWTGYYSVRYRTLLFLILNDTTLAFINGKAWYHAHGPYLVLPGGEHHVQFGPHLIPFVYSKNFFVAVRGVNDENLELVRRVELNDGSLFHIFAREPVVGVVNMNFTEIQLYEDVNID
uniref:Orf3 n=1 Tax=Civet coronavirus HKU8 TaxID=2919017 RepID=A0A8T9E961_9NIDO|nr:orf3 [Civet coronavirus HKU8]